MLKKERELSYLMEKHLDNTREWQRNASEALLSYFLDDAEALKLLVLRKNEFHATGEKNRQEIWQKLCAGAYLPAIRGNIFSIANHVTRISDSTTACCETFFFQQPKIATKSANLLMSIAKDAFSLFQPVYDSMLNYLRGVDVLTITGSNAELFWKIKTKMTLAEDELKHNINVSSPDLWQKTQLAMCLQSIGTISTRTGEMEDEIQMIMAKMSS
jgi:uncharacterized protein Yka (UPF0111/DUF47 family)